MNQYPTKLVIFRKISLLLPTLLMVACAKPHDDQPLKDQIEQLKTQINQVSTARDQNDRDLQQAQNQLQAAQSQVTQTQQQIAQIQQRIAQATADAQQAEIQRQQEAQLRANAEAAQQAANQARDAALDQFRRANHRAVMHQLARNAAVAEAQRETQRAETNDAHRITAVTAAQNAELLRTTAERARQEAETARNIALQQLQQAQEARIQAEADRHQENQQRTAAERNLRHSEIVRKWSIFASESRAQKAIQRAELLRQHEARLRANAEAAQQEAEQRRARTEEQLRAELDSAQRASTERLLLQEQLRTLRETLSETERKSESTETALLAQIEQLRRENQEALDQHTRSQDAALLQVQIADTARTEAERRIKDKEARLSAEISSLQTQLTRLQETVELSKATEGTQLEEIARLSREKTELESQILELRATTDSTIQALTARIETQTRANEELTQKLTEITLKIESSTESLTQRLQTQTQANDELNQQLTQLTSENRKLIIRSEGFSGEIRSLYDQVRELQLANQKLLTKEQLTSTLRDKLGPHFSKKLDTSLLAFYEKKRSDQQRRTETESVLLDLLALQETPIAKKELCSNLLKARLPKELHQILIDTCTHRDNPEYISKYIDSLRKMSELTRAHAVTPPRSPGHATSAEASSTLAAASSSRSPSPHEQATIEALIRFLKEQHPKQEEFIWGAKRTNLRTNPWIVSSPQYIDVDRTQLDPNHHSDNFIQAWAGTIAKAEEFVDVTTLSVPEDKFLFALKAAITTLDRKNKPIFVRLLFGANRPFTVQTVDVLDLLRKITAEIPPTSQLKILIGTYDASFESVGLGGEKLMSWNHSKIVAIDGKQMFTGGHNLYETYARPVNPVHDLSLLIPGPLARIGHTFAEKLWEHTCSSSATSAVSLAAAGFREKLENQRFFRGTRPYFKQTACTEFLGKLRAILSQDPADAEPHEFSDHTSETVIALGRLANVNQSRERGNVSDTAIAKMIRDAQHSVFISQQAVLPLFLETKFTSHIIDEIGSAIMRGVDVYILVSSTEEEFVGKGAFGYSSGYNRSDTFLFFYNRMKAKMPTSRDIEKNLFDHLFVLPTANGNHEVPNHAKLVVADGQLAYVGSHNLYDDSHAEFGVIVGGRSARELVTDYFSPLWHASLKIKQTYADAPHAGFKVGDFVYVHRNSHLPRIESAPTQETTSTTEPPASEAAQAAEGSQQGVSSFLSSFVVVGSTESEPVAAAARADFNPSQEWTLGRVLRVEASPRARAYLVALDFMPDTEIKIKRATEEFLRLAPGGDGDGDWREAAHILDVYRDQTHSLDQSTLMIDPSPHQAEEGSS